MRHSPILLLTQIRAAFQNPLGGSALLVALACSTATSDDKSDVRIAFRDVGGGAQPAPPTQPGPAPSQIEPGVSYSGESLPVQTATTPTHHESHHVGHCCPAPAYTRWPFIGPLHHRWVTRTKPHLQASHWGYPEYFEERPYGSDVLQAEQMQIVNGLRDQQVLYNYDFGTGEQAAELKPRGQYQLSKIVRRLEIAPCPIVIQPTDVNNPNPELDEARRQAVIAALEAAGVPGAADLVVTDRPPLPGLQGVEGVLIYGNLLGQTQDRGGGFDFKNSVSGGSAPGAYFIGGFQTDEPVQGE